MAQKSNRHIFSMFEESWLQHFALLHWSHVCANEVSLGTNEGNSQTKIPLSLSSWQAQRRTPFVLRASLSPNFLGSYICPLLIVIRISMKNKSSLPPHCDYSIAVKVGNVPLVKPFFSPSSPAGREKEKEWENPLVKKSGSPVLCASFFSVRARIRFFGLLTFRQLRYLFLFSLSLFDFSRGIVQHVPYPKGQRKEQSWVLGVQLVRDQASLVLLHISPRLKGNITSALTSYSHWKKANLWIVFR